MTDNASPEVRAGRKGKDGEFKWAFQRLGGLDQVELRRAEDFRRLRELDPKLWVALSCPASGLEFDSRTLSLIDKDRDGRIRIPEILDAVEWISARLKDPAALATPGDSLPLDAITTETDEGRRLLATGRAILRSLRKEGEDRLTPEDVATSAAHASEHVFNGDGILPPLPALDGDVRDFIADAMAVVGSVEDASGQRGINREIAAAFTDMLGKWMDWHESLGSASMPAGERTAEAWNLLVELKDKIDDYFLRCELAAYTPGNGDFLNFGDKGGVPAGTGVLDPAVLAELPISRVDANRPLDFTSGLNPVWRERVERLAELVRPLSGNRDRMTREDWKALLEHFGPYGKALALKPGPGPVKTDFPPTAAPESLGEERIAAILGSDAAARFAKLAAEDADVPAAAADIAQMERMALYHKHLYRLLVNFVSFEEFYSLKHNAAFQAGTLYIDGRACRLCTPVENVEAHSALASNSQMYLLYCACERGRKPDMKEPLEKMGIVAVVTAGDSDLLMQNRNGVFVDNKGDDWDATVVKIVGNPIGLWEAVWSPYKKFGTIVTDQLRKFASDKQDAMFASANRQIGAAGTALTTPPPADAGPQRFDIGRSIGIFAAVGIALGALGTAVGTIARALFAMQWWQFPVLVLGLFAVVSGPPLIIAWLKLRQRTLGPLLEASGWAINGKIAINGALSRKLTSTAARPPNSTWSEKEPFALTRRRRLLVLLAGIAAGVLLWLFLRDERPRAEKIPPAGTAADAARPEGLLKELESALQTMGNTMGTVAAQAQGAPAAAPAPAPTPTPAPVPAVTP